MEAKEKEFVEVKQKAPIAEASQMETLTVAKKELEVVDKVKEQIEKTEEKEKILEEQTGRKGIETSAPNQVRYHHIDICL